MLHVTSHTIRCFSAFAKLHARVWMYKLQVYQCTSVQVYKYTSVQVAKCTRYKLHVRRYSLALPKCSCSKLGFHRNRGNSWCFMLPGGQHITLCFLDTFGEVQCRITPEHRILRAPLEFTAKSLPATAGSTFHARAASWALAGNPWGPSKTV